MLKRFFSLIAAFAIAISFTGCNSANIFGLAIGKKILPAAELDKNIVKGNTEFGIDILKILHDGKPEDNLFISPASISLALAMTLNGADNDTFRAMLNALGLEGMEIEDINSQFNKLKTILENPDPKVELTIANSIWARKGLPFKKDFLDVNKEYYDAKVEELDFDSDKAAETINKW
ncbi:MAG: serpin family protein, partial [Eubacteriales bacterium]|nr:serpin family protein [Eubacteriales bacterium]